MSAHRLVVKVGTSVLTDPSGRLLPEAIRRVAREVAALGSSRPVILVSSGAVAGGMEALGLVRRPHATSQVQACAAIGQRGLIELYARAFRGLGRTVAQVLLTQDDLADGARGAGTAAALLELLERGVLPVVNENDTVASHGRTFGDNDRLAALVACAVEARLLVILTDVEGLLRDGRLVESVYELDSARAAIRDGHRETRRGGMTSKLEAARIAGHQGIPVVIASGTRRGVLAEILDGRPVGTRFVPSARRLPRRKWWIAFSPRGPGGDLVVDAGAAQALTSGGTSLLAAGLREVRGRFEAGACVAIVDQDGREVGRGVTNFSSGELRRVRGLRSDEAARALGRTRAREVVHRESLVLSREVGWVSEAQG